MSPYNAPGSLPLSADLTERLLGIPPLPPIYNPSGLAFNICIVSFNEHDRLYDDVMRTTHAALCDLGYDCSLTENRIASGRVNIVMGNLVYPSTDKARIDFLGTAPFVLYQLEPLQVLETLPVAAGYFSLLDRATHVIEYSPTGFAFLVAGRWAGKASCLPPSFHRCLEITRPAVSQDIDVLFYGSHSDRRTSVMNDLRARGLNAVHLFGVYGAQLWDYIRRSRIVLNMHYRDGFNVLEVVRLVPLLTNRCFVISESGDHNPFGNGIVIADHETLAETCFAYLDQRNTKRETVAAEGYLAVRRLDMTSLLGGVLAGLDLKGLVA